MNTNGTGPGSLAVLNQDNFTVRASFAAGEDALPPYITGPSLFVATRSGNLYKVNSVTMSVDTSFGNVGQVTIGEGVTAGPFPDSSGSVYVGTVTGKVWRVDAVSGAKSLFLDSGANAAIVGIVVTRGGIAVFGTANGTLVQAPLDNPAGASVTQLGGPPAGGPGVDPLQRRVFVTTTGGQLWSIPGA